jgi:hypothetical protein
MWEKIHRVPFGIRFVVAMLVYLALASFLQRFLSMPLAQGLALSLVSVASYPILSERRGRFASHMLYSISVGILLFGILKILSS